MVTLISPYRKDRDAARAMHEKKCIPFLEVFMDVPLDVVQKRDPKGLYAKVAKGEIKSFTGMSADAPYEPPVNAEIVLKNHEVGIDGCVDILVAELKRRGLLSGNVPPRHTGRRCIVPTTTLRCAMRVAHRHCRVPEPLTPNSRS